MARSSDISEAEFHDRVSEWLAVSFQKVQHEVTLPSGRRVDFIAHTPFESYCIEVEDSADSLYNAIGQAAVYQAETGHTPVIVFPAEDAPAQYLVPDWLEIETV